MPYTWRQPDYPGDGSDKKWIDPTLIVIFNDGNIEQAIVPLLRTLQEPIGTDLVGAVFVQESIRERFMEQVRSGMSLVHRKIKDHSHYLKSLRIANCLSAETVTMMCTNDFGYNSRMVKGSPMLVCEFNQSFFNTRRPSTVVTMHTFRFVNELEQLVAAERLRFVSVAVWSAKMATAYEAALVLHFPTVYINCANITLEPIIQQFKERRSEVVLANDCHYEVLLRQGRRKIIIFPAPCPPRELPSEAAGEQGAAEQLTTKAGKGKQLRRSN